VTRFGAHPLSTTMSPISFPFWIVTQRRGFKSPPVEADDMPGIIAVFTTAEAAASFMVSRGETEWENKLVARATLASLLAELRQIGARGICVDPGRNQFGMTFSLDELQNC
jgi:hypothetical protein